MDIPIAPYGPRKDHPLSLSDSFTSTHIAIESAFPVSGTLLPFYSIYQTINRNDNKH